MTMQEIQGLRETIREALIMNRNAPVMMVVNWIRLYRRAVFDANLETLGSEGLAQMVRSERRQPAPKAAAPSQGSLCLDFGLPEMDLASEVSIPIDRSNLIYGGCTWKDPDDLTIPEIELHIELEEAMGQASFANARAWRQIAAAARRVAGGRMDLTIGELRERARGERN